MAMGMWKLPLLQVMLSVDAMDVGEIWADAYSHVVVIPDVHGDIEALLRSLWLAHRKIEPDGALAFDDFSRPFNMALTGGHPILEPLLGMKPDVALVQLGDLVDRGPFSSACVFAMALVPQVLGWRVVRLYGNHEIMSFMGESSQFVHPADEAFFGGAAFRNAAYAPGGELFRAIASNFIGVARLLPTPGRPAPVHNPATLFVHGGMDMDWLFFDLDVASDDIAELNEEVEIAVLYGSLSLLNQEESILWTRDLAQVDEAVICGKPLEEILDHFQVARIIVGHTPQSDGVAKARCGGRIILADVMMSRWMTGGLVDEHAKVGGNPVALIMTIDRQTQELESIIAHHTDLRTGTIDRHTELVPSLRETQRTASLRVDEFPVPTASPISDNDFWHPWPVPKRTRLDDSPQRGALVSSSPHVAIVEATAGDFSGVMNILAIPGPDEVLLDRMGKFPLLPRRIASVALPDIFLVTACTVALRDWMSAGNVPTGSMLAQVVAAMHSLHANHIVVGLDSRDAVTQMFATDLVGAEVRLINWASVRVGSSAEIAAETAVVTAAVTFLRHTAVDPAP